MDDRFLEPGTQIHDYVVERVAAVGGEAVIYEARDPVLGRTVALKLLRDTDPEGAVGWRRLEGEGRYTARLDHPAFVTVYGVFPHNGGSVLVMEWVDGSTLAERLARGPLTGKECRALFSELAEALATAHRVGAVHGDLSPSNVMVRRDGRTTLLDPALPGPRGAGNPRMGTRSYAAPELVDGGRPTPATDVWAFGALLEESLGPRPRRFPFPRRLERLARRCLDADPARRPVDGRALVEAIESPGRRWAGSARVRLSAVAAAGALIGAAVLTLFQGVIPRLGTSMPMWDSLERLPIDGSRPVLLPDGGTVAYRTRDALGIGLLSLASGRSRTVWRGDRPIEDVAVFPDGRAVLFSSALDDGGEWLWEIGLDGGLPRKIAPGRDPSITGGGNRIAALQRLDDNLRRLVLIDRSGTEIRTLHTFRGADVPISTTVVPSDDTIVVITTDGINRARILAFSPVDGAVRTVAEVPGVALPGAAVDGPDEVVIWPVRAEARGEGKLLMTSLEDGRTRPLYAGPGRTVYPSLGHDGKGLAFQITETDRELVELDVDPEGGPPIESMTVIDGTRGASQPRLAPDGRFLLMQSSSGSLDLLDRLSGGARRLLGVGISQFNPAWSPDGSRIVCACLADGRSNLWIVRSDGSSPERLTNTAANDYQPVIHPDGRHILFISDREGVSQLFVLTLGDGKVRRLSDDGAVNPAVSPDGRSVAFVTGLPGRSPRLRLSRLDASVESLRTVWERPVVVDRWSGAKPRFSPDGRWIAFDQSRPAGGGADLWALPVEGGGTARPIRLTAFPFRADLRGWFDWGPDWKIIATVTRKTDRLCVMHRTDS